MDYSSNKNHLNEYTFVTKENTIIAQREWQFGYIEVIKPKNAYFHTFNKYYKNGELKLKSDFFLMILKKAFGKNTTNKLI
ncbi:MAG: hypothetical protein JKY08_01775 [Flavobacteriaceae bacterium]|nr:hypothetical protein [Flavobacteriaceae bacterium]